MGSIFWLWLASAWGAAGDTALINLHHRIYDPALARFIAPDPSYQEPNLYSYARSNPPTLKDDNGLLAVPYHLVDSSDEKGGVDYPTGADDKPRPRNSAPDYASTHNLAGSASTPVSRTGTASGSAAPAQGGASSRLRPVATTPVVSDSGLWTLASINPDDFKKWVSDPSNWDKLQDWLDNPRNQKEIEDMSKDDPQLGKDLENLRKGLKAREKWRKIIEDMNDDLPSSPVPHGPPSFTDNTFANPRPLPPDPQLHQVYWWDGVTHGISDFAADARDTLTSYRFWQQTSENWRKYYSFPGFGGVPGPVFVPVVP